VRNSKSRQALLNELAVAGYVQSDWTWYPELGRTAVIRETMRRVGYLTNDLPDPGVLAVKDSLGFWKAQDISGIYMPEYHVVCFDASRQLPDFVLQHELVHACQPDELVWGTVPAGLASEDPEIRRKANLEWVNRPAEVQANLIPQIIQCGGDLNKGNHLYKQFHARFLELFK
jgi:hypothetical protein